MAKKNSERRMIPFGIDLNTIPREESVCKAIIPIDEPVPLPTIPLQPCCYGCSYFAHPVRTKPLLLEGAPLKGPIIALPAGTNILPPKRNEKLLGVRTNKKGEVACAKYSTGDRTYFEGVRAHPMKVKFNPPKETPKSTMASAETPRKRRKMLADLEKELAEQCTIIASLEACQRVQSRYITYGDTRMLMLEHDSTTLKERVKALEHPKK